MRKYLFLAILIAVSGNAAAQDTTGGTRPMIVIPLNKTEPKPAAAAAGINDTAAKLGPPASADERKLRNMARAKKKPVRKAPK